MQRRLKLSRESGGLVSLPKRRTESRNVGVVTVVYAALTARSLSARAAIDAATPAATPASGAAASDAADV